jgi:hypothetical protein
MGVLCPLVPYYTPKIGPMTLDCIFTGFLSPLWFGSVVSFMDMCSGLLLREDLIKGFQELRVEFGELKKARGACSSQRSEEGRKYARRCVWCDEETEHTLRGCEAYEEALKNDLVIYKDGKIHDAATNSPLRTNFGRGGMKKLMKEKMTRTNRVQVHGVDTYHVQVEQHSVGVSSVELHVQMKRGLKRLREQLDGKILLMQIVFMSF